MGGWLCSIARPGGSLTPYVGVANGDRLDHIASWRTPKVGKLEIVGIFSWIIQSERNSALPCIFEQLNLVTVRFHKQAWSENERRFAFKFTWKLWGGVRSTEASRRISFHLFSSTFLLFLLLFHSRNVSSENAAKACEGQSGSWTTGNDANHSILAFAQHRNLSSQKSLFLHGPSLQAPF